MIEHFERQIESGWLPILTPLIEDKRFEVILSNLAMTKRFEPHISKIFRAFKECPYGDLRIVMLGQDPYPQLNVATGLAFGNEQNVLSPSLEIIMEELKSTIDGFNESHFLKLRGLEHWTKQGILLINSALTVMVNSPGSHHEVWRYFIEGLLRQLSINSTAIVYVLFGKVAQSFESCIKADTNYILKVAHPAADTYADKKLFRGSKIFTNVNKIIHDLYGYNINWI